MSLMAGFDLVVELSNETVLKLIRKSVMLEGQALEPPFELSVSFSSGVAGTAHLVFTGVELDLNDDDTLTLTLPFKFGTVMVTSPFTRAIGPLSGNLTIRAAVQGGTSITVDMAQANATMNLDAASTAEVNGDLSGTGVGAAIFLAGANQALTQRIRAIPNVAVPLPFTVVPGVNGRLTPTMQLEALEVHCIGNADRKKQALGIFGTLLASHHGQGHHAEKTSTAISSTFDGMAISLSPSAFHELIFKPATQGINPGNGIQINSLTDTFANGQINIAGKASKSGFCYDATATFAGTLTLTASGTTVTPHLTMGEPDVDVDIPWYCYLAVGVVLGPLAAGILAIVDAALDGVTISLGNMGAGIGSINFGSLSGATFTGVDISPAGMTIQGRMSVSVPNPFKTSSLSIDGSVITTESMLVGSGTFSAQTMCAHEPSDYEYDEYQQKQRAVFSLSSVLTVLPLTPVFELKIGSQVVALNAPSGSVAVPNVTTRYVMPVPSGTEVVQTVHLTYTISGTQLTLYNTPAEGNYAFSITAKARDIDGDLVQGLGGSVLSAYKSAYMEGNRLAAPEWAADQQECMQQFREWLKRIQEKLDHLMPREELFPKWPPVNYPAPDDMLDFISKLVQIGAPEVDEILVGTQLAHSSSFTRALLSEQARTGFSSKVELNHKAVALAARNAGLVADLAAAVASLPEKVIAERNTR